MTDKLKMANALWGGFVKCPTTGMTRGYLKGDDKVVCFCDGASQPGTHRVSDCEQSDAATWIREMDGYIKEQKGKT